MGEYHDMKIPPPNEYANPQVAFEYNKRFPDWSLDLKGIPEGLLDLYPGCVWDLLSENALRMALDRGTPLSLDEVLYDAFFRDGEWVAYRFHFDSKEQLLNTKGWCALLHISRYEKPQE